MNIHWSAPCLKYGLGVVFVLGLIGIAPLPGMAQITPDETLGNERSQVNRNVQVRGGNADRIEGGATRGANLFHSFQEFNVNEGQRVYFANPAGVANILSRVTGRDVSDIMGTLGVEGGANLFLLNPNGIIFGPNARLDISGSFVGSTADSFTFPDGTQFSATNPGDSSLLSVSVPLGVQYGPGVRDITNAGNLAVNPGQGITLYGGTVISSGSLTAPGGTVQVLGDRVGLTGNARIDVSGETGGGTVLVGGDYRGQGTVPNALRTFVGPGVTINADALSSGNGGRVIVWGNEVTGFYGNISARGGSLAGNGGFVEVSGGQNLGFDGQVDVSATNGSFGTLLLDPRNITISNADSTNGVDASLPDGLFQEEFDTQSVTVSAESLESQTGNVVLEATDNITIDTSLNFSNPDDDGSGGPITFIANAGGSDGIGSFTMQSGDTIDTNGRNITISGASITLGNVDTSVETGNAGSVTLDAAGDISTGNIVSASGNVYNFLMPDYGDPSADNSSGENGNNSGESPVPDSSDVEPDNAGTVELTASGNITVGDINASLGRNRRGAAGNIRLNSGGTITPGDISSDTFGIGSGGAIDIQAGNEIKLDESVISSNATNSATNDQRDASPVSPGNITIQARSIQLTNGGQISTQIGRGAQGTEGTGDITITTDELSLTGGRIVEGRVRASQINSFLNDVYDGDDSDSVRTDLPAPRGRAGDITINLRNNGSITISGSPNATSDYPTGIFSSVGNGTVHRSLIAPGDANGIGGTITLNLGAGSLTIGDDDGSNVADAGIAAKTFAIGDAGNIIITGNGSVTIQNGGFLDNSTDSRGSVSVLQQDGSRTDTLRSGNAGAIDVTANSITLTNDSPERHAIQTSVQAPPNGSSDVARGSGGPITITAGSLTSNNAAIFSGTSGTNSGINTSTGEPYGGGNIYIIVPTITLGSDANRVNEQRQPIDGVTAATTGGDQAGSVSIATTELNIRNNARVYVGTRGSGDGGDISLQLYPGEQALRVDLESDSQISASTSSSGGGGDVSIIAPGSATTLRGGRLTVQTNADGDAGTLNIEVEQLNIEGGTQVSAQTRSGGDGGDINVDASQSVALDNSRLSAQTSGAGRAGDIFITTPQLTLDRSNITVSSRGESIAGNITINADDVSLDRAMITATTKAGAGSEDGISLEDLDSLRLNNQSEISASTVTGRAGNVTIDADDSVEVSGDSRIAVEARDEGVAGNLTITADDLTIQDGAEATVSNRGGVAGSLRITANSVTLNQGTLEAIAGDDKDDTEDGNITLNVTGTLLQLYDHSQITAGAENRGNGGNVTINAENGFVLADPYGDSDILANAVKGAGGDITINTNAIFGLERRNSPTHLSDINAESEFSTSGNIVLNTLNIDPTRGLGELPVEIFDAADLVAEGCVGSNRRGNETQGQFTRSGRGGLSPNPTGTLTDDSLIDQAAPADTADPSSTVASDASETSNQPIVEAQGLARDARGKVSLIPGSANSPATSPVFAPNTCDAP